MISDLLKILQAIQTSQSAEERAQLEQELNRAVEDDIRTLFAEYENRRRTFGAIRENLGIFDPPEKQEELKNILYAMGARPQKGSGDKKYWHLPDTTEQPKPPPDPRTPWSLIYAILLIGILLLGSFTIFDISWPPFGPAGPELCDPAKLEPEEFDKCMNNGGIDTTAA